MKAKHWHILHEVDSPFKYSLQKEVTLRTPVQDEPKAHSLKGNISINRRILRALREVWVSHELQQHLEEPSHVIQ